MSKLDSHFKALIGSRRLPSIARLRIQKVQTHVNDLEKKLAEHEKDITEAARSLAVPLPDPGSDLAKVIRINRKINLLRVDERAGWKSLNDNQSQMIKKLEDRLEDCDCGPQLSPDFQPCCGIMWEEEQHKKTCKYYCEICGGHNEYCDCDE